MRTLAEYGTMAALLGDGWEYDKDDHTMCKIHNNNDMDMYDPETMEFLGNLDDFWQWKHERRQAVKLGRIGCVSDKVEDELR